MNMQTQALPIQVTPANPAPQRANASQPADGAQFSQALSREMEQRQHSPAPAPAAPPKQAAAAAKADQGKPATASANADDEKDDAADAVAASPVADMLALVASFNQPATAPVADPAAAAAQAAAAAALKGAEGPAAGAIKLDAVPVAGDALPVLKGQAIEDAGRFALKGLDASAKDVDLALPRVKPEAESLTAQPGADVRKAAGELATAAVKADATSLRAREGVLDIAANKEPAAAAPVVAPVQQASLAMAQAVNGAPTDRIAARIGTPGWDNQVAQKIVWMVAGKEQSATLTLNPPDMGPMQVVLSVTNDQATVTFSAAQPEVRQALENAMPKLREMMGENGIALGNASVNAGSPEQRQAQQGEQSRHQGGGSRFGGGGGDTAGTASAPRVTRLGTGTGLVDTFA
ncbi:MAG: hypothetical protein JWQ01_2848 [Massilia sp.]|nr:hypothetical protein [Massilia sp.]